ncbi:UDP-3-O-(3-hydroxymyristoyl)glucosamine N-acyltransferase [Uliginosibacterium sp. sgz301328]|uniref:UDP-3-O-(3-hydroxymyristoyl)glucosamine N-acyltransferase n=1 Tax=Uliginosibacterium sp. sgz301328 TaxID=3243764 RepID=UPI00359EFAEC
MAGSHSLYDIVEALGGECRGDGATQIRQVAPLDRAGEGEIGFVAHAKYRKSLETTKAAAVIVPPALADAFDGARIVAADPYLYFARLVQFLNPVERPAVGIHPTAVVLCEVPPSASIGPLVFLGDGCVIGDDVIIEAGCVIEGDVTIGAGTHLHPRVTIYRDSIVGRNCVLHAGAVIGSDGFGFARRKDGSWEKIPQIGRAILGDDVEVGANTTIDRGALDDTVIERGVKLDNLIQIAHNCRVGENSAMAAFAGMAGSSSVGRRVMVGGQAGIMGHVSVADDVVVSARSFISKSVSERGVYTSAIPAQSHHDWMRNAVHLKNLDALAERVRTLEKKINELNSELESKE